MKPRTLTSLLSASLCLLSSCAAISWQTISPQEIFVKITFPLGIETENLKADTNYYLKIELLDSEGNQKPVLNYQNVDISSPNGSFTFRKANLFGFPLETKPLNFEQILAGGYQIDLNLGQEHRVRKTWAPDWASLNTLNFDGEKGEAGNPGQRGRPGTGGAPGENGRRGAPGKPGTPGQDAQLLVFRYSLKGLKLDSSTTQPDEALLVYDLNRQELHFLSGGNYRINARGGDGGSGGPGGAGGPGSMFLNPETGETLHAPPGIPGEPGLGGAGGKGGNLEILYADPQITQIITGSVRGGYAGGPESEDGKAGTLRFIRIDLSDFWLKLSSLDQAGFEQERILGLE